MEREKHVHILVNDQEHELIQKRAAEEEMSISEYMRYTVLLECFYRGDVKAYKMLASGFTRRFMEWFNREVKKESRVGSG